MRMAKQSETAIAKPVLVLLADMGFDCYQEVPLGRRADIVGILAKRTVCVVECKTALTFDVIAQAKEWIGFAHWRFVAVPYAKQSDGRRLAYDVCAERGIGIIEVGLDWQKGCGVRLYPRLNRAAKPKRLLDAIRPEHKTFAEAGSKGSFWSPWRESVDRMVREIHQTPGIPLADLVARVPHHWGTNSSAKGCIARQIQAGIIKGLRLETESKVMRVYPALVGAPA